MGMEPFLRLCDSCERIRALALQTAEERAIRDKLILDARDAGATLSSIRKITNLSSTQLKSILSAKRIERSAIRDNKAYMEYKAAIEREKLSRDL
jgi:hypothetical protein